ncbi:EAL domain-containing protein [Aromatoleum petrolei]|uniref:EAL domain-containing protein n=2 Tax=Aromatoleum petrolei TaxID=76116 RepID=A0ABX1MKU4_9RHOO|nr:EAL domain-containing protein [Aromatoleum petrolei]NMF87268.1 EAL domain-containing protein [Aromatoleum petrolei]
MDEQLSGSEGTAPAPSIANEPEPGRALAVLRVAHAVVRAANEESVLLRDVCRAIVDAAASPFAALTGADAENGMLPRVSSAVREAADEAVEAILAPDDSPWGRAARDALRAGRPFLVPAGNTTILAVLPLCSGPELLGTLQIAWGRGDGIGAASADLLQEAANALAYGIHMLRQADRHAAVEEALRRVNRARKTLSEANRALVRATEEHGLLQDICRIIVEDGGYRFAWVGYALHDDEKNIAVMAQHGIDRDFLDWQRVTWSDGERGHGATGVAIRTGQPSVGRNIRKEAAFAPWREEDLRRGIAAISAFPLRQGEEVLGNLTIAATEEDAFDEAEANLLGELADDLSFGIATLRLRERNREAQETIKRMAEEDALTGLPNRWRLRMRLVDEIDAARARSGPLALLVLGVNHFQEVNETLGYQQGDAMLCEVAARIRRVVHDTSGVARVGESEFAILLPHADAAAASRAAQRLLSELLEPVTIGEIMLDAGASIGIAVFPGHGTEADALIRRANVAMHQARQQGHGHALYTGGRDRECARRLALIGDLHRAIDNGEMRLYCQPKARLSSGELCGVEALVRWEHPQRGTLWPNEFISLAEHSGLISPLTDWVMQAAFRQSYVWRQDGLSVPVAVNLSARDLRDPKLIERVRNHFATWGADPGDIQFELTESALMHDPQGSLECLKRLKDLGSTLFIDDFGTGYSSLAYLQKLPVDAIKIDKSFVQDMLSNSDSDVIVRSTIDLAHDLDLEVVAEGVEDRAGWEHLSAQGCDMAQGYVISEPLRAEAFTAWRSERAWRTLPH